MEPKKKSSLGIIIGAISIVFAVYFGAETGMSWSEAVEMGKENDLSAILKLLTDRLNGDLFANFFLDDFVLKGIGIALFVWFLIFLMLNSNRRNFIHGKEYGTARWGSNKDIKDLFAKNIEAEQLRDAKKVKNAVSRFFLKRKLKKQYKTLRQKYHSSNLSLMETRFNAEILDAKQHGSDEAIKELKARQATERKERMGILKADEAALWREMWEPAQIQYDFQTRCEEIEKLAEQGLSVTQETKAAEIQKAEADRDKAMQKFLDVERKQLKIKAKYLDADCLLTHTERTSIYNYKINNNILIMGGAGAGKSRGFVVPNLLQAHSSYVVTDPKGEVLEKTGHFLKEQGYKIKVLNLDAKSESDGYNPFVYIHPERAGYEERIMSLVNTLIKATTKEKSSGSQDGGFWENAERLFLQAVFFFTVDGFRKAEQNINTVMDLIAMLEIQEERDNKQSDLDIFAQLFEERLNERDTVNHNAGTLNNGVKAWKEFRSKASGKTAKGIVITAVARLAPFRTSGIRRILQHDDMGLERLGEEKMAVFIVVPPTDDTFNFIAAMMFTQMFQELQYCATQVHKHEGQRLPIPVRFILDEFANTCAVPEFEKILAYARSFGIGIVPILQSLDQLKALYKDTWRTIVDNCSAMLYLGNISSDETLKYISDLLGKGTFDKRTTGRSRGRNGSSSENYDVIGRELMTPDEIRRMDKTKCLLIISGRYPFYSDKYDMTEHRNYLFTSDGNPQFSYHHEKVTHSEYIDVAKTQVDELKAAAEAARKRAAETIAQVDKEVDSITLDTDAKSVLRFMTSRIEHLNPLVVPNYDNDEQMNQAIHECLVDVRSEHEAMMEQILEDDAANPEVTKVVQEAKQAAEKITLESKPSQIAKHLKSVKSIQSLKIVDTTVKENDDTREAEVKTVLEQIPDAEAREVMHDQDIDDLSSMLDSLDWNSLNDISESGE